MPCISPACSILTVCDSWFGNKGLFAPARELIGEAFHLLSRLRSNIVLYAMPQQREAGQLGRNQKHGERLGSAAGVAATLRCPVRVTFVYRRSQWIALSTTDLSLSVEQIIEFYGARWKIESGFKEIKQDIGASRSQMRNAQSVMNHLNFCMMAAAVTWLYAIRLEHTPERRHIIRGRSSFAFSDVRHIIAKAVLSEKFARCRAAAYGGVNESVQKR